jgi:hypothetical protein
MVPPPIMNANLMVDLLSSRSLANLHHNIWPNLGVVIPWSVI